MRACLYVRLYCHIVFVDKEKAQQSQKTGRFRDQGLVFGTFYHEYRHVVQGILLDIQSNKNARESLMRHTRLNLITIVQHETAIQEEMLLHSLFPKQT